MAEEFQESEVIFSEDFSVRCQDEDLPAIDRRENSDGEKSKGNETRNKTAVFSNSVPVNIPENVDRKYTAAEEEEEYSDRGREIVPPHVIVGRRIAGQMAAFSVCTGNGRTLKGRDLSRVRNSVLRLTGFLEA